MLASAATLLPIRANLSPCADVDIDVDIDIAIDHPSNLFAELSFEAGHERLFTMNTTTGRSTTAAENANASTPPAHTNVVRRQQGVLWKRRDVFKNRWRPRWFVLHPGQGVLTYYLLSNNSNTNSNSNSNLANVSHHDATASSPQNTNRRRTFSESSTVSQNPMDYDVVPRGTIYLLGSGCKVEINRELTRASDELFVFTITSNTNTNATINTNANTNTNANSEETTSSNTKCHLAARTAASRARWIRTIQQVCDNGNDNINTIPQPSSSSQTTPIRTNRSLLFEQEEQQRPDPPSLPEENADAHVHATPPSTPARPRDTRVTPTLTTSSWKTIPSPLLFQNVPSPLELHMEDLIAKYLPLLDPVNLKGWTPLFDRDGVVASTRMCTTNTNKQQQLLQSSAVVPHPPPQILNLLLDTSHRKDWEHNVRHDEQLVQYNPHTRLEYAAYLPVWPTSARDFAVCVQWRLVTLEATAAATTTRQDDYDSAQQSSSSPSSSPAILLVTCSVPQADALKPMQPNHVRAHLEVSLQLLQYIDKNSCRHTRILSYDLCGNIPKHLTNHIMMQQANLPRVVHLYLQRIEPTVPAQYFTGLPLTNDYIIQNIVQTTTTTGKRSLQLEDHQDSIVVSDEEPPLQQQKYGKDMTPHPPSLVWIATVLMAPIIVYNKLHLLGKEWIFLISAWYAIRWVVLAQIGKPLLPKGPGNPPSMVVTCRFTVDLKGVLRFISNKQEERQEINNGADADGSDISVTHIVMTALAQSLVKYPSFNRTHISYPLLLVDGYVANESIQMGIPTNPSGGILSVQVEHKTVQEIADALAQAEREHALATTDTPKEPTFLLSHFSSLWQWLWQWQSTTPIPQFVVMATPDSDHCQVDIDAGNLPGVTVAVVVSGIRLVQKKPTLSMSLTIQSPLAVETCREFAEHVQKLVQFPEMCDE
jgi:hypothetical protein